MHSVTYLLSWSMPNRYTNTCLQYCINKDMICRANKVSKLIYFTKPVQRRWATVILIQQSLMFSHKFKVMTCYNYCTKNFSDWMLHGKMEHHCFRCKRIPVFPVAFHQLQTRSFPKILIRPLLHFLFAFSFTEMCLDLASYAAVVLLLFSLVVFGVLLGFFVSHCVILREMS